MTTMIEWQPIATAPTGGEWMPDVLKGFDPPEHPRTCQGCKPVQWPKLPKRINAHRVEEMLPGVDKAEFNHGYHLKFCGRFNFWPTRQKWYDESTGQKGQGAREFVSYVRHKFETVIKAQRSH